MKRGIQIGQDSPGKAFIIAEAGINHNGNYALAARMIEEAAKAGADAVKFQNFRTEDFIFGKSLAYTYCNAGKKITESMWDLCKRNEVKKEWLPKLKKACQIHGVEFISTPTSAEGVRDLIGAGVGILKNGSDYLLHLSLLRYMGGTGLLLLISTGMASKLEIKDAIHAVRQGGDSPIILLHCTSTYPTLPSDVNLKRMVAIKKEFCLPVGFSDHTVGSSAAVQAVSLGACVLEKHFTLDHNLPGPDHWFSQTPQEFTQYVRDIREAELRMGKARIEPSDSEKQMRGEFRLGLICARNLVRGHSLRRKDFVIAKPGLGLPPKEAENVIGRMLLRDIKKGTPIKKEYLR